MKLLKTVSVSKSKSINAETYRMLKTNIQLASLDRELKIIMVASSGSKEGKSGIASNLAVALAQSGKKTILIDTDFRKPNIHKIFRFSNEKGLSNVLLGKSRFEETVYSTEEKNLYVITAGAKTLNHAELLGSSKLKNFLQTLKQNHDYIIVDTPPVTVVPDAQIISKYVDGCVFVVGAGKIDRMSIIRAIKLLEETNTNIIGAILNKTKVDSKTFFENYNWHIDNNKENGRKDKILSKNVEI